MRRPLSHTNLIGMLCAALLVLPALAPPESPVADAAQRGDTGAVRELLRGGADVNAAQGDGMTALHWAAHEGNVEMTEVLLFAGGNLRATTRLGGYTPLHLAAKNGHAPVLDRLLEAGSEPDVMTETGVTALHFAAMSGRPDAAATLLGHGAAVNLADGTSGRTPLMLAAGLNRLDVMPVLMDAGADLAATTTVKDYAAQDDEDGRERARRLRMLRAAQDPEPRARPQGGQARQGPPEGQRGGRGAPDAVPDSTAPRSAPQAAPDPDQPTPTPAAAPDTAAPDTTSRPSAGGAPGRGGTAGGNEPRPLSYTDLVGRQGGMTALHYAAREGFQEAVDFLLEAGADVDQVTEGDRTSPLLIAVLNGHYDLAMSLLARGADPNLVSEDGAGPLFATINDYWSLRTWHPQPTAGRQQETTYLELMEALLDAGADPNARLETHIWYSAYNAGRMGVDFAGATPFWRAAYGLDVDAMRLLVTRGADPEIRTTKPAGRRFGSRAAADSTEEEDPSGLPPVPVGDPSVHPLHAASGVGYGTSRVGQQHRHVPDGWLPAVRYLVEELGADVNVRDHDGYSPLHNAAARGDDEMIRFLVEHGADVMAVSRRGQTTVDMANGPQQRVQPFPETIALLEGMGAVNNHNCQSC